MGKSSPTGLPERTMRRSKYICNHEGMPEINVMSAEMVSSTMASTFCSQSSMQLVR